MSIGAVQPAALHDAEHRHPGRPIVDLRSVRDDHAGDIQARHAAVGIALGR
jgi:hypothetical protein